MMLCFFFKQKTAYEMRISDWSSDVCSSDLFDNSATGQATNTKRDVEAQRAGGNCLDLHLVAASQLHGGAFAKSAINLRQRGFESFLSIHIPFRSEEHTSELQSLMRTSYAVFCLKKKK